MGVLCRRSFSRIWRWLYRGVRDDHWRKDAGEDSVETVQEEDRVEEESWEYVGSREGGSQRCQADRIEHRELRGG